MYSFDDGRLAALAGSCYRQLGKLTAAERTLQEALEALDASRTRRRSEALLELALVQLEKEDIDKACRFATQSYAAASRPARSLVNGGSGRFGRVLTGGAMPRPCGASMSSSPGLL
jgi:tetratricopeptide (TPR) repeat protein